MANLDFAIETKNYGQNIRLIRKAKGIKQEILAERVCMSQQTVSRYEQMEIIDDKILERFASALDVSMEEIKDYKIEDAINFLISDSTFNEGGSINGKGDHATYNINPLDKLIEVYDARVKELKEEIAELKAEVKELRQR